MKIQRIKAVARKEFLHVFRDWRSLGMGIAIPMIMLFLFGYALTLDVDRVPLIVWDQSNSPASREFVSGFTGSHFFALQGHAAGYQEIEQAIDDRSALIALVVPRDFARSIEAGKTVAVQAILDGSDPNTATFALGYAEAVTGSFSRKVVLERLNRMGMPPSRAGIDIRPRVWFNSDMVSKNYIFPGLIAIVMMVIASLLTSLTIAREWENGTMEQLLATPVTGPELILGKLTPYFAIGLLDLILCVIVGEFFFAIPLRGSLVLLFALSLLFLLGALGLGMLISIVTKSQLVASQLALVATMLPAFLLSGFIFPIENMPVPIQFVTRLVSASYFVVLIRGIYLKDVGLNILAVETTFLAVFCLAVIALSVARLKKKIE
ncbi:ABC transporter, membrane protein [Geotalea daltonii FRC-32]|uniref:ABC transporter, membrane protein n=1 Tax=Geotalea daltonii (strain DSM 22248 / JCM 15807 / FRC-32) TaxID=316067 RepID=B9M6T0_GEODF|nr:ABC transporter permease [Geotalea daltonii]ACM20140.1 ABC transporter, membrane protein [Geotalea daltonii FRC-32]